MKKKKVSNYTPKNILTYLPDWIKFGKNARKNQTTMSRLIRDFVKLYNASNKS